MKKKPQLLLLLFVIALTCTLLTGCTSCDNNREPSGESVAPPEKLAYTVNPDGVTCTVTGLGTVRKSELVIPDELDGYRVSVIDADAFFGASITSLTLPDTVVEIGSNAFFGCARLCSVTLSENLLVIREGAFRGCAALTSICLPERLTRIEQDAFYGCRSLTDVYDLTSDLAVSAGSTDNGSVGRYAEIIHKSK